MGTIKNDSVDRLYKAILGLNTMEECHKFFDDICTIKEIIEISQRLDVAIMLSEGKTFQTIASEVGASTTTIGRVNKCLNYGDGGYKIALKNLGIETDKGNK